MYYLFDIQSFTKVFEALSSLTGLHYSLYDDKLQHVLYSGKEDKLLEALKTDKKGREFYMSFISTNLKASSKRKEPFIIKGPLSQYHIFIPIAYKNISMTVLAEAFYSSLDDFRKAYTETADQFGLNKKSMGEWTKDISIMSLKDADEKIRDIRALVENLVKTEYEKGEMNKQRQWSKIIISIMTNLGPDASISEIHQTIIDAVTFLFDIDTAAIFSNENGYFLSEIAVGRHKDFIRKTPLTEKNHLISQAYASKKPVSVMDSHKLWHAGFPEEITSMHLFPVTSEIGFFGFLGIFNTTLEREAFESINELCRLSAYLCGMRNLTLKCEKRAGELNQVSAKALDLSMFYKQPGHLYESIVNEASNIVKADRCSLMLPQNGDDNKNFLRISAVKGLNKWLMESVKVRIGEGISGKVYAHGVPILIDSEEKLKEYVTIPKTHYKTFSAMSLPLKVTNEVIGVLNLSDKSSGEQFSEKDMMILNSFAVQASLLLKLSSCHTTSEQMKELSITDFLTGLLNRRYFDIRLEDEYQRAKRYTSFFSLVIADIDDFKLFNDSEGHLMGDYILKEISSIMTKTTRVNDVLVRFGGEEFAIIMPQTSKIEAFNVAERIRNNIKNLIQPTWKKFPRKYNSVSIGIAMYPECGDPKENIIRWADKAMYKAKTQGKDCTVVRDAGLEQPRSPQKDLGKKADKRILFL